jgi:hypothetical protein
MLDLELLSLFPKFELSYDIMTHKNVHDADIIMAIPEGIKCFIWFTKRNYINVCLLLELNNENQIVKMTTLNISFNPNLSFGTVLYGVFFDNKYICIEDMYYGYGHSYVDSQYHFRLTKIHQLLERDIQSLSFIFGVPIMNNALQPLLKMTNDLPYKIDIIKFRYYKGKKIMSMKYFKPGSKKREAIMKIKPDIELDIYHVYSLENEYCSIASIPDYKTSVMMNKIFRKIKANDYLDAIEESDDEEEFEDIREDKYVFLDRIHTFRCEYNYKFKKWTPIQMIN